MWNLADKYHTKAADNAAKEILEKLAQYDPFIYARSKDRQSIYIHFRNLPFSHTHKLRISNHNERKQYGYKWQLRLDGLENIDRKEWSRYFATIEDLITEFNRYYGVVRAQIQYEKR